MDITEANQKRLRQQARDRDVSKLPQEIDQLFEQLADDEERDKGTRRPIGKDYALDI